MEKGLGSSGLQQQLLYMLMGQHPSAAEGKACMLVGHVPMPKHGMGMQSPWAVSNQPPQLDPSLHPDPCAHRV